MADGCHLLNIKLQYLMIMHNGSLKHVNHLRLGLLKLNYLLQRPILHHFAKFCGDWADHDRNIVTFDVFLVK